MLLVQVYIYINISTRILSVNNVNKQSSGVEFDIISVHTPGCLAGIHLYS